MFIAAAVLACALGWCAQAVRAEDVPSVAASQPAKTGKAPLGTLPPLVLQRGQPWANPGPLQSTARHWPPDTSTWLAQIHPRALRCRSGIRSAGRTRSGS